MAEARILYLATDDGVIQLANPGRSDRWREVGRSLTGQPARVVVAAPHDPLLAVAATDDTVYRTSNGGISWDAVLNEPATALAIDNHGTLYAGTRRGALVRSEDGVTWQDVLRLEGVSRQIVITDDDAVVLCDDRAMYRWQALDRHWQAPFSIDAQPVGVAANVDQPQSPFVVISTSQSQTLPSLSGALVVLGGAEPVLLVGTKGPLLRAMLADVAQQPSLPTNGVAANLIALDKQAATSLQQIEGPYHVTALVTPPRFLDHAFATTAHGELWFSTDRGRSWTTLRSDLPPAHDLAFARAR